MPQKFETKAHAELANRLAPIDNVLLTTMRNLARDSFERLRA